MTVSQPPSGSVRTVLPSQQEFAQAFFIEAIRHLIDARILHQRLRFAAAVTSSMKGAEFGVKAALILEGGLSFLDKLFGSHKPLTDATNHVLFQRVPFLLESVRLGLATDVKVLEALAPKPFGADRFTADETNTEYPYLERVPHPAGYQGCEGYGFHRGVACSSPGWLPGSRIGFAAKAIQYY